MVLGSKTIWQDGERLLVGLAGAGERAEIRTGSGSALVPALHCLGVAPAPTGPNALQKQHSISRHLHRGGLVAGSIKACASDMACVVKSSLSGKALGVPRDTKVSRIQKRVLAKSIQLYPVLQTLHAVESCISGDG